MNITPLSQRDIRWSSISLGDSYVAIGNYGCFITCIAMVLGVTPDVVNRKMIEQKGYTQGNLVVWSAVTRIFGGTMPHVLEPYNNEIVKSYTDKGKPVLVTVDGSPIGAPLHMVVYIGNKQLIDPWNGRIEPTGKYRALKYIVYLPPAAPQQTDEQKKIANFDKLARYNPYYNELNEQADRVIGDLEKLKKEIEDLRRQNNTYVTIWEKIQRLWHTNIPTQPPAKI